MRKDVVINDITSAVAALGLTPLVATGTEVIFDLNVIPSVFYHPGVGLGGIALSFVALATKVVLLRPYFFDDPFDRYIARAIR